MINFNLAGDALIHCLKVSGATVILVDEDEESKNRVEKQRSAIEGLRMRPLILSIELKDQVNLRIPERPDDSYRAHVKGDFPAALFYTRCVLSLYASWGLV